MESVLRPMERFDRMKNVLIAPADGPLGTSLLDCCLRAGCSVVAGICAPESGSGRMGEQSDHSASSGRTTSPGRMGEQSDR